MDPISGKHDKKSIVSAYCKNKTTIYHDRTLLFFLLDCHGMWLVHLHGTVNIQPFSPVFPLAKSTANAFCWLSPWSFKEKTAAVFYGTAFRFMTDCCFFIFAGHDTDRAVHILI